MNTPKLLPHVGPPRSATTSLQIALQKADCDALHYGGTFQPRKNNAGSLAETLYGAAAGRLAADDFEVRNALNEIHRHVREEARSVMISREIRQ